LYQVVCKVNLGCGINCLDGWINIDNSINAKLSKHQKLKYILRMVGLLSESYYGVPWSDSIIIHDIRKRLPFLDESIDFVYISVVLESLKKEESISVVKDAFRVLNHGGIIRIVALNLEYITKNYVNMVGSYDGNGELPSDYLLRTIGFFNNQKTLSEKILYPQGIRRYIYDQISLSNLLGSIGFIDIHEESFGKGKVPDISKLDYKGDQFVYLEATKP